MTTPDDAAATVLRRRPRRRWRRVLVITGIVVALFVSLAAGGLFLAYRKLDGNIQTADVSDQLGPRPTQAPVAQGDGQPLNILVIGSDTRVGQDTAYGTAEAFGGQRSDTTLLMHISGDRSRVTAVSFPRDLLVDIPSCVDADGDTTRSRDDTMFNQAFSLGGPGCTIKTVEDITGVFVDHFIVVDFAGFKQMVDSLGGVDVCVSEDITDEKAGLELEAGVTTVKGEQALAFVRARNAFDGTADIGRIQRQQAFISSMIQKLKSNGTLLNLPKLYGVLDAATSAITTDPELGSLNELRKLAQEMSSVELDDITFLTVPWVPAEDDPNRLELDDAAEDVFEALREDQPWPPVPGATPSAAPSPSPTAPDPFADLTIDPRDVRVTVLNAGGVSGAARAAADELEDAGFQVVKVGDAPSGTPDATSVVAGAERQDSLKTLAAAVPSATRGSDDGVGATTLILYVGSDYDGVIEVELPDDEPTSSASPTPSETPTSAAVVTADLDICSVDKRD